MKKIIYTVIEKNAFGNVIESFYFNSKEQAINFMREATVAACHNNSTHTFTINQKGGVSCQH